MRKNYNSIVVFGDVIKRFQSLWINWVIQQIILQANYTRL